MSHTARRKNSKRSARVDSNDPEIRRRSGLQNRAGSAVRKESLFFTIRSNAFHKKTPAEPARLRPGSSSETTNYSPQSNPWVRCVPESRQDGGSPDPSARAQVIRRRGRDGIIAGARARGRLLPCRSHECERRSRKNHRGNQDGQPGWSASKCLGQEKSAYSQPVPINVR